MMKPAILLASFVGLTACVGDETIARYAVPGAEYELVDVDGAAFGPRATITFPEAGRVVGQGPCNRYSAPQSEVYPWFNLGPIAATRMACPDLAAEAAFFDALAAMTLAEVAGNTLILTAPDGREMVFRAP